LEVAIWVIGLIAAVFIIVIYIITSVNKYSNSFVGKYFNEEKKNPSANQDVNNKPDKNLINKDDNAGDAV